MHFFRYFLVLSFLLAVSSVNANDACPGQVEVDGAFNYSIDIDSNNIVKKIQPEYFGFNLEWLEFQWSLWDSVNNSLRPDVKELLSVFPGAIYRYPGGTAANSINWRDIAGEQKNRPKIKHVSWSKPFAAKFGIDEYLNFVKQVNGKAWYVANMHGNKYQELPPKQLLKSAAALAQYIKNKNSTPIFRWELGNELDQGVYKWSPEKIASISEMLAESIQSATNEDAKFVSMLEAFDAQKDRGYSASTFNKTIAKKTSALTKEFAMHIYYDGKPGGQPIPTRVKAICNAIHEASSAQSASNQSVWVTEHARVPPNAFVDPKWKESWPRTADLEAAIGVADFMIAGAQIPKLRGAFVHALHGSSGPWPIFHRDKEADNLRPGAVYWVLRILRESMLENVLSTQTYSRNHSGYDGGYDIRSVVMSNNDFSAYSMWVVNRHSKQVKIAVNGLSGLREVNYAIKKTVSGLSLQANNYDKNEVNPLIKKFKLKLNKDNETYITLPPYSVVSIVFSKT